jgi:hypothetical protein
MAVVVLANHGHPVLLRSLSPGQHLGGRNGSLLRQENAQERHRASSLDKAQQSVASLGGLPRHGQGRSERSERGRAGMDGRKWRQYRRTRSAVHTFILQKAHTVARWSRLYLNDAGPGISDSRQSIGVLCGPRKAVSARWALAVDSLIIIESIMSSGHTRRW